MNDEYIDLLISQLYCADPKFTDVLIIIKYRWTSDGKFIGIEPMKNELILCTQTYNDTNDFRSFGNTVLNQCKINLTVFAKENKYPVYFYQMYLKVGEEIYEIPVTVDNFE